MEQKQERSFSLEGFLILILMGGVACNDGDHQSAPPLATEETTAWVSLQDDFRVILEPLPAPALAQRSFVSEETMLQDVLGLEETTLVRLHLLGQSESLQKSGQIFCQGAVLAQPLGDPPTSLDPRARNLWIGLGLGGGVAPLGVGMQHRTFLLRLLAPPSGRPLHWQGNGLSIPLESRSWSGAERRLQLTLPATPDVLHG